jgi:hypothetical protein
MPANKTALQIAIADVEIRAQFIPVLTVQILTATDAQKQE